jgi:two-component system, LytTR family, sensor kinase
MNPTTSQPERLPWKWIIGGWALYWVLNAAQSYFGLVLSGAPVDWGTALLLQFPLAGAWFLFTPAILWLGRRFPLRRGTLLRNLPLHIVISWAFVFLLDVGYAFHTANVMPPVVPRPLMRQAVRLFVLWILSDGLLYWIVLLASYAADRQRRLRERELASAQLETQLAQADLQALKMQLHPHFLFNALHTIGALVRTADRENAVRVVAQLGELLRRLLEGASQQQVSLEQEVSFIRSYLEIEQIRFRDRLKVTFDVPADVLPAVVPHLILQPLVENAIRHGIAPHSSAGLVSVSARRVADHLELLVRDDGPGLNGADGRSAHTGIGLANTRARLQRLYADDYRLAMANAPGGGFEARLVIPFEVP